VTVDGPKGTLQEDRGLTVDPLEGLIVDPLGGLTVDPLGGLIVDPLEGLHLSLLEVKCNERCVTVLVWFVMFGFNLTLFRFYIGVLRQPKRPQLSSYK